MGGAAESHYKRESMSKGCSHFVRTRTHLIIKPTFLSGKNHLYQNYNSSLDNYCSPKFLKFCIFSLLFQLASLKHLHFLLNFYGLIILIIFMGRKRANKSFAVFTNLSSQYISSSFPIKVKQNLSSSTLLSPLLNVDIL